MNNRNILRPAFGNISDIYSNIRNQKKLYSIEQFATKNLSNLKNIQNISYTTHKVEPFETLQKISFRYYSSPEYAWVICYTNKIGCELDIEIGQYLKIYFPIISVIQLLE